MKALALLVVLALSVSCKSDLDLYNIGKRLGKIGINVDLQAKRTDKCLARQVESLRVEFNRLTRKERKSVTRELGEKYAHAVILPSKKVQTVDGVRTYFSYVEKSCSNNNCVYTRKATKELTNGLTVEGEAPINTFEVEGKKITIEPQYTEDFSVTKYYYTRSVDLYDKLDSLETVRDHAGTWLGKVIGDDRSHCAKETISLEEML